ncbi:MAG: hypothetical protein ACOH5I_25520 [Oligoflexus sp.]
MKQLEFRDIRKDYKPNLNHAIIEQIWGHRFRVEQNPMLLLCELLCVLENQFFSKETGEIQQVFSPEHTHLKYKHSDKIGLRFLLYKNDKLESIKKSSQNEKEKFKMQIEYLKTSDQLSDSDITHLEKQFDSFDSFYNSCKILSSLTFDPLSNKRWGSKFVYPLSRDLLWSDYNNIKKNFDRRFFARGGELIYLMLSRTSETKRDELEQLFDDWMKSKEDSYSKLVKIIYPAVTERDKVNKPTRLGHLPYVSSSCFETLADDLITILKLDLERLDKAKLMADMIGFHIGNYILTIGEMFSDSNSSVIEKKPHFIVEIPLKSSNSIRKSSIESISRQKNKLKNTLNNLFPAIVNNYFFESLDVEGIDQEKKEAKKSAEKYLSDHIMPYPNACFRHIGFVSKKHSRSYRYVFSEDFLQSIVITVLGAGKRLEFSKFIKTLEYRYNIFVDRVPDSSYSILQTDLNKNTKNLSNLLYQMGMLRHLSDACSYVINPYREDAI